MYDDEKTSENQNSDASSLPTSPEEPTPPSHEATEGQSEPVSENTADPEPSDALPEAPETPQEGFEVKSNDIPPSNSTPSNNSEETKSEEEENEDIQANEILIESNFKPALESQTTIDQSPTEIQPPKTAQTSESQTAQTSTNESLPTFTENTNEVKMKPAELQESIPVEPEVPESFLIETKSSNRQDIDQVKSETVKEEVKITEPKIPALQPSTQTKATHQSVSSPITPQTPKKSMSLLLAKEHLAIQNRRRKKLDKIMTLFNKKKSGLAGSPQVTNDEVEKLLHVSNATVTRYLEQLEKEERIKQNGKTGKGVFYTKI